MMPSNQPMTVSLLEGRVVGSATAARPTAAPLHLEQVEEERAEGTAGRRCRLARRVVQPGGPLHQVAVEPRARRAEARPDPEELPADLREPCRGGRLDAAGQAGDPRRPV